MSSKRKTAFTATTVLFVICILPGAVMNIVQPKVLVDMSVTLGVPLALMTLMGLWKLLGAAALAVPHNVGRLKEWAYAGFFFDLSGAAYLHTAAKDFAGIAPPLVLLSVLVASYLLRPSSASATAGNAPQPSSDLSVAEPASA